MSTRVVVSCCGGSAHSEGWALYCEQLMQEQGFLNTKEHRFVMLKDRLWRALRIIIDVKTQKACAFEALVRWQHPEYGMLPPDDFISIAERIAVDSYREIATYFAAFDSTTRKMIEEIQAQEEEHADDLADLLNGLPKTLKR